MDVYDMLKNVKSKEDFIDFTKSLSSDFRNSQNEWSNIKIDAYLEAIQRWVSSMDNYYKNTNAKPPSDIDWNFIATIFYIGRIYD